MLSWNFSLDFVYLNFISFITQNDKLYPSMYYYWVPYMHRIGRNKLPKFQIFQMIEIAGINYLVPRGSILIAIFFSCSVGTLYKIYNLGLNAPLLFFYCNLMRMVKFIRNGSYYNLFYLMRIRYSLYGVKKTELILTCNPNIN